MEQKLQYSTDHYVVNLYLLVVITIPEKTTTYGARLQGLLSQSQGCILTSFAASRQQSAIKAGSLARSSNRGCRK